MVERSRRIAVLVIALALMVLVLAMGSSGAQPGRPQGGVRGPGAGNPPSPPGPAPARPAVVDELSDCVQESGSLIVLFLVDESQSMGGSDPDGRRVDGIQAALRGLERITESPVTGQAPYVEARFAAFAADYRNLTPWTEITTSNVDRLEERAEAFASRDDTLFTNYQAALVGARESLNQRAADLAANTGGRTPCRAVIWLTDGKYFIGDGTGRATAALCQPSGPADDLHSDGIFMFTVALIGPRFTPEDADYLGAVTEGEHGSVRCGESGSPATGTFIPVDDRDMLQLYFCCFLDPSAIIDGSGPFEVSSEIGSFVLNATTGSPDIRLELVPPRGGPVLLDPRGPAVIDASGATLNQEWSSDQSVEVVAELPAGDPAWAGTWQVNFLGPDGLLDAGPHWTVTLTPGLEPVLVRPEVLTIGEETTFDVEIRQGEHLAVGGPLLASARLQAVVEDPVSGESTVVDLQATGEASYSGRYAAPDDTTTPELKIVLILTLDASGRIDPSPIRRLFPVRTEFGERFADVTLEGIPSTLTGDGPIHATVRLETGTADNCVWIDEESQITGPDEAGSFTVRPDQGSVDEGRCLRVSRRGEATILVTIEPDTEALGAASGRLVVGLRADGEDTIRMRALPVAFAMRPEPNVSVDVLLTAALLLIAVLIPLGLLLGLNYLGARFDEPHLLRFAAIDVAVTPNRVVSRRNDAGAIEEGPLELDFWDLEDVQAGPAGSRLDRFEAGLATLEATAAGSIRHRSLSLLRGPFAEATAGDRVIVGGAGPLPLRSWQHHRRQEVPLGLRGTWLFVVTSSSAEERPHDDDLVLGARRQDQPETPLYVGQLVAFVIDGGGLDQLPELSGRATQGILDHLPDLRNALGPAAGVDTAPGGWLASLRARWATLRDRQRTGPTPPAPPNPPESPDEPRDNGDDLDRL